MFPAAFDYRAPATIEEALAALAEAGDEAKVMAGGQSLIPLLKLRFASPSLVLDIGRLPGLRGVETGGGMITIGALTRHADLERNRDLAAICPILADTAPQVSDPLVRNQGTVGGSIAHADPSGDWGSVMIALNAQLVARSSRGERVIAATEFFQGPFTTALAADEILTEIRIPAVARAAGTYLKLERKIGDFATVAVAVQVEMSNGNIGRAGIGLTSVGAKNLHATAAEQALKGAAPTQEAIGEAARMAAAAAEPKDDIRGTAAYKRDIVRVFVQRGLKTAIKRAQEVAG
ncbi:MAG TPA: xanthine dehydrogenase family protein subunit M [Candidatus Dormibacteraeota bacterium]|nr:xanthine dehydrogenase family protein subunit M [Candidatus Dormibacteraeota bacterium]